MRKVTQDINDVVTLDKKSQILHELQQDELIDLFKGSYKTGYKPVEAKPLCLDQQVAMSISEEEKKWIQKDYQDSLKTGQISLSSYIRNKILSDIDVGGWFESALKGIKVLTSDDYNEKLLLQEKKKYQKYIDDLSDVTVEEDDNGSDDEKLKVFSMHLKLIENKLESLKAVSPKRSYRVAGRVTFDEANHIKWRAGRLSLSVADYLRFLLFGYYPNSENDKHMSLIARKRFYISVLDVYKNGWGNPPQLNGCPNCARYQKDIQILKEQIARYQALEKARRI
jgi:hypothetical protein